jgi:hypothetical protein
MLLRVVLGRVPALVLPMAAGMLDLHPRHVGAVRLGHHAVAPPAQRAQLVAGHVRPAGLGFGLGLLLHPAHSTAPIAVETSDAVASAGQCVR